jgi:hypothetical protein
MENAILKVIQYFALFSYPPSLSEIYSYLPKKATQTSLKKILTKMVNEKRLISDISLLDHNEAKYTLPQYSKFLRINKTRRQESIKKFGKVTLFISLLSRFPQIRFIGLSGSVSMQNAKKDDDIDLFIITSSDRLWTGRLISILIAQIFGKRRTYHMKQTTNKICLNLFFDENHLLIPRNKQNEFVAHEVLQMKPLINKHNIYNRFLKENKWICHFFPNTSVPTPSFTHSSPPSFVSTFIEKIAREIQLFIMKPHITSERIEKGQLWFHPRDYEKRVMKKVSSR